MPLIPEGVLDDIQARVDIAELIGRYVPLKRVGRHFKTNCPFHKEKTPSFMVNTEKQIFHCFGCGVGGNVFSFLMQHDRLSFPEAVQQLADHAGIRMPDRGAESRSESLDPLFALAEKACKYFERQLADPEAGRPGREYLKMRGVSEATAKAFRLGFAPVGWRGLLTAAGSTGVSPEQLESVGLVVKGPSSTYDRFRSRLIFPILDVRGRVVGFGGRSLDGQEPKYLNSPETPLYSKSRHVYGLAQAKDAIVKAKTAIIVEGYFDCVGLADAGLTHVVAPLGTALTVDQARLLRRYADRVILAFDPDAAGEQATLRGIDLVVETGLDVLVAQFPAGMDPDDYVRRYGRERTEQLLEHGINLFEFLVQSAVRRFGTERTEAKVHAAQFVLPTIAKVPDAMLRREYVRQLAERMRLDEHAVVEELGKTQPRGASAARPASAVLVNRLSSQAPGPERLLTALVLDEPQRWAQAGGAVSLADVTDPTLRRILGVVCELTSAGRSASAAQVVSRLSQDGQDAAVATLVELAGATPMKDQAFQDCIHRIQGKSRQRELANLREQIRAAQEAKHEAEWQRLLAVYQQRVMKHGEGG